jgi:hypothetical protein
MRIEQLQSASSLLVDSVTAITDGGSDTDIEYGGGGNEPARVRVSGDWGDIWE